MSVGPFWKFYGGKWRAAPRYPAPECRIIVEHFAGAAGYGCRYPHHDVILVDADPIIAGIWDYLIRASPSEILALPLIPDGGTVDDMRAPQEARWLAGFWCNNGVASPRKAPSAWVRRWSGRKLLGWCPAVIQRIAADAGKIKHWKVIHGDYSQAPRMKATHFIDPPYQTQAGRHYRQQVECYRDLSRHTLALTGQVIACDQRGADWLPWTGSITLKSTKGTSSEVLYHRSAQPALW